MSMSVSVLAFEGRMEASLGLGDRGAVAGLGKKPDRLWALTSSGKSSEDHSLVLEETTEKHQQSLGHHAFRVW